MSSEFSLEMPSLSEQGVTADRLDRLQEEIEQLKSNCQLMDEEFETVKCNRNLPGLSELMEAPHEGENTLQDIVRQQSAKACFKGLYSLTTINRSMSMDLSVDEDSPQTSNQFDLTQLPEEEHFPSLEWDEEYCPDDDNNWAVESSSTALHMHSSPSPDPSSKLDTSGYGSKLDLSSSLTCSQFSCFESPSSATEDARDINTELPRSMSCDSQNDWNTSDSEAESPALNTPTPGVGFRHANIGPRVDILTYAHKEWMGDTPKAKTILRVR